MEHLQAGQHEGKLSCSSWKTQCLWLERLSQAPSLACRLFEQTLSDVPASPQETKARLSCQLAGWLPELILLLHANLKAFSTLTGEPSISAFLGLVRPQAHFRPAGPESQGTKGPSVTLFVQDSGYC